MNKNLPPPSLGFPFSYRDEQEICFACAIAREFMRKYGNGRKPCDIDKSKYFSPKGRKA